MVIYRLYRWSLIMIGFLDDTMNGRHALHVCVGAMSGRNRFRNIEIRNKGFCQFFKR